MAEAGLALAVFGAFNNAIQCFDYVYLAKNFNRDPQTSQLKLDVAKLRLSRWGRSVGLEPLKDPNETTPELPSNIASSPEECERATQLLGNIRELFREAENSFTRLRPKAKTVAAGDPPLADLDPSTTSLHQRLNKLSLKNFGRTRVLKRTKWALFTERHANRLVEDISEQVSDLVELFPTSQPVQRRLCQEEGKELAAHENISLIEPLLAEQDPDLDAAIKQERRTVSQVSTITFERSTNHGLQLGYNSGTLTNNFGSGPR